MALVTAIIGDCPGCGHRSFGNVAVHGTQVSRGCEKCRYHDSVGLPEIKKKIIYLDQFFFSHAFRGNEPRFKEALAKISRLAALQLLVAPYSSIHEDETHQWKDRHQELFEFIKASARGHEFEPSYEIERVQIFKAFNAWRKGEAPKYILSRDDAVPSDVDEWDNYYWVDVGGYTGDIELRRRLKGETLEGLVDLFPGWRQSTNTFQTWVAAEHDAARQMYMDFYLKYMARLASGDMQALVDAPIVSTVVQGIMHSMPDSEPVDQRLRKCAMFLMSDHFTHLPYQRLSAHIYATLKHIVKNGAYQNRRKALKRLVGFYEDVKHIATYAPYCDAIIIDQAMADLVSKPTVALEAEYGVKVFSLNNWAAFLAWLDDLEAAMDPFHKWGLAQAYPHYRF